MSFKIVGSYHTVATTKNKNIHQKARTKSIMNNTSFRYNKNSLFMCTDEYYASRPRYSYDTVQSTKLNEDFKYTLKTY